MFSKPHIQLVLATIGLTILIWVYADQQGYRTERFQVAVTVSTAPGIVAHVAGATPESRETALVTIVARGPNVALRELPLNRPPVMKVTVRVTENVEAEESRAIDINEPVATALRERGLQLQSINPSSLTVRFDRLVRQELQVQVDAGAFHQALSGTVQIDPPLVTVTLLASQLAGIPPLDEPRLLIPIEDELRAQPGETDFQFTVSLKNRKWQGLDVKWEPERVTVSGRLQQLFTDLELRLIPLRVLLPWDWPSDQYEIVWLDDRDRLQKVELKVPVGKPNVLTNTDVTAFISIDTSLIPPEPALLPGTATQPARDPPSGGDARTAVEPSPFSRTVRFVFPPGFEDVRIVSPPSVVKFRIVPRKGAESSQTSETL